MPLIPQTDAEWDALIAAAPQGEPTPEEQAALDDAFFSPAGTTLDQRRAVFAARKAARQPRTRERGPQKTPTKVKVGLRLDADALARWKATGKGYQTRMADMLAGGPA